jgi:hypothetical protein
VARRIFGIGVALAAVGLAAPVAAQSVDDDVRCLLASNFFARTEKDADKKQLAGAASAFYLGRLDARISNDQLRNMVLTQAKTLTGASVAPLMNNCAKRLAQKGVALRTIAPPPPGGAQPRAPVKPK